MNAGEYVFQWWEEGVNEPRYLEVVFPPEPMGSTSAKSLWRRFHGPAMKQSRELERALYARAIDSGGLALKFMNTDYDSANELYLVATVFALSRPVPTTPTPSTAAAPSEQSSASSSPTSPARATGSEKETLQNLKLDRGSCYNHHSMHTVVWLVTVFVTLSHMSTLYSCVSFIGMGTHMFRLISSLPSCLRRRGRVRIEIGEPLAHEVVGHVAGDETRSEATPTTQHCNRQHCNRL